MALREAAWADEAREDWVRAAASYARLQAKLSAGRGADSDDTCRCMSARAECLRKAGRLTEAEPLVLRAVDVLGGRHGFLDPSLDRPLEVLFRLYAGTNRRRELVQTYLHLDAINRVGGPGPRWGSLDEFDQNAFLRRQLRASEPSR